MTSYLLDAMVVVIFLFLIGIGTSKGFTGTVARFIGYIVAISVATSISAPLSEKVYDEYIHSRIINTVESNVDGVEYDIRQQTEELLKDKGYNIENDDYDKIIKGDVSDISDSQLTKNDINDTLKNIYDKYYKLIGDSLSGDMPEFISDNVKKYVGESIIDKDFYDANSKKHDSAIYIEKKIVKPVVLKILRVIVFAVVFAFVMLVVKIIVRALGVVKKIPVIGGVDRFFGGLLGLLEATIITILICSLIYVMINVTGSSYKYINDDIIQNTYAFKIFYNFVLNFLS